MSLGTIRLSALCAIGALSTGACVTETAGVKVRAVGQAPAAIGDSGAALARAQGLLNLGNPGLALEAFRTEQRDRPSAAALAGIAACYVAMGRDDLAKTNIEAALALSPNSPDLLRQAALVMDRLGLKTEALAARRQAQAQALADRVVPSAPAIVPSPSAEPAPNTAVAMARATELPTPEATPELTIAPAPQPAPVTPVAQVAAATITVPLPPVREARSATHASAPRLERLSSREVALVTRAEPFWVPNVSRGRQTSSLNPRWTPLIPARSAVNVRLLNAARIQGLASAARSRLIERGWRKIEVGDFAQVRASSVVLYPAGKRKIGLSLARHFGIAAAQTKGTTITILLGRDVARRHQG